MKQLFNLFFALLLSSVVILQSGCKDEPSDNPLPDVTASYDTVYGTVKYKMVDNTGTRLVDWDFGPAMVRATAAGENIATAALSSDGTFMLVLPETVSGNYFTSMADYAQTLGGSIVISPQTLHFVNPIEFMVDYTDNGEAKHIAVKLSTFVLVNNKPVVSKLYTYNFYDQDGSFAGTDYYGNVFNWTFIKGWGMNESYGTSTSGSTTTSKSVNAAPADAVWAN
jgi:hypothetical protein